MIDRATAGTLIGERRVQPMWRGVGGVTYECIRVDGVCRVSADEYSEAFNRVYIVDGKGSALVAVGVWLTWPFADKEPQS